MYTTVRGRQGFAGESRDRQRWVARNRSEGYTIPVTLTALLLEILIAVLHQHQSCACSAWRPKSSYAPENLFYPVHE